MTDVNGAAVIGATVTIGGLTTSTTQTGAYAIAAVSAGTASVAASEPLNGHTWTGQNSVTVDGTGTRVSNVNILISDPAIQATITGIVRDGSARPLAGARVFAGAPDPANPYFTTWSGTWVLSGADGSFTLTGLPAGRSYLVTATVNGHSNESFTVTLPTAGLSVNQNFVLAAATTSPTLPVITGYLIKSFTLPTVAGRAAEKGRGVDAVQWMLLRRLGLSPGHAADASHISRKAGAGRSTPSGALIENILYWDYVPLDTLYGYSINRSAVTNSSFAEVAVAQDPLADRFVDLDSALTPDTSYYYSVARLDTVNYPLNKDEGTPSPLLSARPFVPMTLLGPADQSVLSTTPTFSWTAINRAVQYQIYVYDRYPNYTSDTDGVLPIWPTAPSNPGASLVLAGQTSQTYQGPLLKSGSTYYWTVIATDGLDATYSIGPIRSFIAP